MLAYSRKACKNKVQFISTSKEGRVQRLLVDEKTDQLKAIGWRNISERLKGRAFEIPRSKIITGPEKIINKMDGTDIMEEHSVPAPWISNIVLAKRKYEFGSNNRNKAGL